MFIAIIAAIYAIYMKDFEVLKGVITQQNKFANSIFLVLILNIEAKIAITTSTTCMYIFIAIYIMIMIKTLFTKKISFTKSMRTYNNLLLIFIFGTITSFQSWYVMWLYSTIMWQKEKMINLVLAITSSVELAKSVYFLLSENILIHQYYYILMLALVLISTIILNMKVKSGGNNRNEQIEG